MALPTYISSGTFTAGAAAISPPFPGQPPDLQANDIALLVVESENQAISLSSAQGFVEVGAQANKAAGTAATNPANRIAVYWKRLTGPTDVTAPTVADSGDHQTGQIHIFRGCKTTGNPWNVFAEGNDGGVNDTSGSIPGATTTAADCLVVLICGSSFNGTSTVQFSAWTNADLASLTERTDNTNTTGLGGGHGMATGEKASAGAYGATTVTLANTSFKGTMSIALEGAGAVTTPVTLAATGVAAPTIARATTFGRSLAAASVAVATITPALAFGVSMAATGVAALTITARLTIAKLLSVLGTGLASLAAQFVAGGGGPGGYSGSHRTGISTGPKI